MCNLRMALRKVFVYGTLKRGQPNHYWLLDNKNGYAKFVCRATTTKKLPLIIATRYNIPFLLNKPGHGNYVAGEIYEVDDKMINQLDHLEDCPNLYEREIQDMNIGIGEGTVPCWVYLLKNFPDEVLNFKMFSEYKNNDELPYTERSLRIKNFKAIDDLCHKQPATASH